jgi:hypothetical protein
MLRGGVAKIHRLVFMYPYPKTGRLCVLRATFVIRSLSRFQVAVEVHNMKEESVHIVLECATFCRGYCMSRKDGGR